MGQQVRASAAGSGRASPGTAPREARGWGAGGVAQRRGLRAPPERLAHWGAGDGGRRREAGPWRGAHASSGTARVKKNSFQSCREPCSGRSVAGSPPRQSGVSGLGRRAGRGGRRQGRRGAGAHTCAARRAPGLLHPDREGRGGGRASGPRASFGSGPSFSVPGGLGASRPPGWKAQGSIGRPVSPGLSLPEAPPALQASGL